MAASAPMGDGYPHTLYRFFNADGTLLYVGRTANLPQRLSAHRRDKDWHTEIDHAKFEVYDTADELADAERLAIKEEKPRFNVVHNRTRRKAKKTEPKPVPSAERRRDEEDAKIAVEYGPLLQEIVEHPRDHWGLGPIPDDYPMEKPWPMPMAKITRSAIMHGWHWISDHTAEDFFADAMEKAEFLWLPERLAHRYDASFYNLYDRALTKVGSRWCEMTDVQEPGYTLNTILEEIAGYAIIQEALQSVGGHDESESIHQDLLWRAAMVLCLNEDPQELISFALELAREQLHLMDEDCFEDHDVRFVYYCHPANDGLEDNVALAKRMGFANLPFDDWLKPFRHEAGSFEEHQAQVALAISSR